MFQTVFVGGTYDALHVGHKSLLTRAFGVGERVEIGLTSDAYVGIYKHRPHRSFDERRKTLVEWLEKSGFADRTRIVSIDNPYEPAAGDPAVHAIVVTIHNRIRAEEINAMRVKRNLTPLAIIEVPLITAEDGLPVSSTRVREGEIDESGHLIMPEVLRSTLQQPLGTLYSGGDVKKMIGATAGRITVTVGDVSTKSFLDEGVCPTLSVIDLQVRREPFMALSDYGFPKDVTYIEVASGPGYISQDSRRILKSWAEEVDRGDRKKTVLIVRGEEDLLALPVILNAPEGAVCYYGQPPLQSGDTSGTKPGTDMSEGIVEVVITRDVKERVKGILSRFD
jgi:pantetheine-phosphate adenylyltransferase